MVFQVVSQPKMRHNSPKKLRQSLKMSHCYRMRYKCCKIIVLRREQISCNSCNSSPNRVSKYKRKLHYKNFHPQRV